MFYVEMGLTLHTLHSINPRVDAQELGSYHQECQIFYKHFSFHSLEFHNAVSYCILKDRAVHLLRHVMRHLHYDWLMRMRHVTTALGHVTAPRRRCISRCFTGYSTQNSSSTSCCLNKC